MEYILLAIIVLIWIGVLFASISLFMDTLWGDGWFDNDLINLGLGIAGLVLCVASLFWAISQDEAKPCAQYDTRLQYNPATKTTMPMKYCAVEGEWVK